MKKDAIALVGQFSNSILKQREAIRSGTTRQVRYYGRKLVPIAKKLLQMGDDGKREFATLLDNPDKEIRATAAVYLISSMPDKALSVFRELAEADDFDAECAQLRIKEWEEHPEHYDPSNWVP